MRRSSRLVSRRSNEKNTDERVLPETVMPEKVSNTNMTCKTPGYSSKSEKRTSQAVDDSEFHPLVKLQKLKILGLSQRIDENFRDRCSKEGIEEQDLVNSDTSHFCHSHVKLENNGIIYNQSDSKENIKLETSESDAEDSDVDQDESFSYIKMREENMKANEDFFASLGINKAKEMLQLSSGKKKLAPSQRGLKMKKEPKEPLPIRKSLRIRRVDPVGNPLPDPEPVPETHQEPRLPPGPVSFTDCVYSKSQDSMDEEIKSLSSSICRLKPESQQKISTNMKTFLSSLEKVSINEDRVAKVVPGRVFSVTWHPSPTSLIAVAGDKYGHIGIWNVGVTDDDGQDIVRAFKPHIKPVSDLIIPAKMPHKLFSCSYDATLRCADFEHGVFNEIFSLPEVDDDLLRNMSFIDEANTMLVSQFSGNVSLVDLRSPTTLAEHVYPVSRKSLRTVSVHPLQRDYFITAGIDTNINLWDLRSMKTKTPKPVQTLEQHRKSISSAYFSPSGNKALSCSADDTINVYIVESGMKMGLSKQIRHNNYTGRWLTNFKPTWHPTVENVFVSGSMSRPREIQVFDANGTILKSLTDEDYLGSVCSLNAFHPNKTCTLVGANSSGRLHVFM